VKVVNPPTFTTTAALAYITIGALMAVWAVVWFSWLRNAPESTASWYVAAGVLFSGIVLVLIGLTAGPIGRLANQANVTGTEPGEPTVVKQEPIAAPSATTGATPAPGAAGTPASVTAVGAAAPPSGTQQPGPEVAQAATAGTAPVASGTPTVVHARTEGRPYQG
jgi:hypothetical protein